MSSATNLLIRQARILLPTGDFLLGDVKISDGQIVQVASDLSTNIDEAAVKIIDAAGLTLLPGVIDPQVHFREPGLEYKEDLFTAS